jgi:endonuclease YncB( thermonuclease family)
VTAKVFGPYEGVVSQVQDGDTVYAQLDLGFDLTVYARVRVYGINAPELSTVEGKAARDYARTLLPVGTAITVVSYGWDKYGGRIDGAIRSATVPDYSAAMIAAGHAVAYYGIGPKT